MSLIINGIKVSGRGKDGVGIPTGGTVGQILVKKHDTDYDTEWVDLPSTDSTLSVEGQAADAKIVGDQFEDLSTAVENKADASHTHDDVYYTETEIDTKLAQVNMSISDIITGSSVVAKSRNATNAEAALTAESAITAESATKATQDADGNIIVSTYETKEDAQTKLNEAKSYTDTHANNKANPHGVTAEQIGAVTKEYVDEAVASGGSVKTVNNIEPDENGNIQLTAEVPSFSVSGTTLIIGSISIPKPLIAYAVYSADDSSLSFYKTADTITEGSIYRGKTATAVFPDIENNAFEEFNGSLMPYPVWSMYSGQFNRFMNSIIFVDKGISPTSTAKWFANLRNCTNIIGLNKLNTSNVTDMSEMFAGLNEITSIDISDWDTSNVTNMSNMFDYCEHLTSIGDISNWDTSNVTDMNNMFAVCDDLTSIGDISNWDTGNVTNMSYMFAGCVDLTSVGDISNWDTSNVTDMSSMFLSCINLTADCSGWNVDNVTNHTDFTTNGVNGVIAPTWKN